MGGKAEKANYAIKVNKDEISLAEYQSTLRNTESTFRQLFGNQYDKFTKSIDVKKQVKQDLINRTLLYQEALKKEIPISNVEIINEINKVPSFITNGDFDEEKYRQILNANGLTPAIFEESVKRDLTINKLAYLIQNSVGVKDNEIKNEYFYRNTSAKISYISTAAEGFEKDVVLNDNVLKSYYDENKENYRVTKQIKLKYVKFTPEDFEKNIVIPQSEIESYYIKNQAKFYEPEKIKVRHILIKIKNWDNESEISKAKEKADKILKELKKKDNFEELAKKYSDDLSGRNGGLLGYIKRDDVVKEFGNVAFSLMPGQISNIVKTSFGFHIIKVDEKIAEKKPSVNDLKETIRTQLTEEKKKTELRDYALSYYRNILNEGNLTAYTTKHPDNATVYDTDFFSITDNVEPLGLNMEFKEALFNLEQSEVSRIYYLDDTAYIFEVTNIVPEHIPELIEIKDKVKKDYVKYKAKEIGRLYLKDLISKYKDLDKISEKLHIKIKSAGPFKRIQPINGIGSNTELQTIIFSSSRNTTIDKVFDLNEELYIVRIDAINKPSYSSMNAYEKKNIYDYLYDIKSKEALKEYLANLKKEAHININPSIE
jgi:peptidyl-prolyl cis-trans isomerase D